MAVIDTIKVEGDRLTLTDTEGFVCSEIIREEKKIELAIALYRTMDSFERRALLRELKKY